jgi:hypothetical protein
MIIDKDTVERLLYPNVNRSLAYITVLTDATVYIDKKEHHDPEDFVRNGFPLKLYGVHEIRNYRGDIFLVSDTDDTDIRVIEY